MIYRLEYDYNIEGYSDSIIYCERKIMDYSKLDVYDFYWRTARPAPVRDMASREKLPLSQLRILLTLLFAFKGHSYSSRCEVVFNFLNQFSFT